MAMFPRRRPRVILPAVALTPDAGPPADPYRRAVSCGFYEHMSGHDTAEPLYGSGPLGGDKHPVALYKSYCRRHAVPFVQIYDTSLTICGWGGRSVLASWKYCHWAAAGPGAGGRPYLDGPAWEAVHHRLCRLPFMSGDVRPGRNAPLSVADHDAGTIRVDGLDTAPHARIVAWILYDELMDARLRLGGLTFDRMEAT